MAAREPLDLILCDIQLQTINGYEVVRQLKHDQKLHHIPVVAVTAYAMVGDRDKILGSGFDGYIAKPIVPEKFVEQVEAFLPASQRSAPRETPASVPAESMPQLRVKRATILLVDDSQANISVACSILEPFGYDVLIAGGVEEALHRARQNRPDMVLCDLHLNHESGADLVRAMRADPQLAATPLVIFTSTARQDLAEAQHLAADANRFILRPIDPQKLLAEIEQVLQSRPARATVLQT